jgi:3'-phosphoadenosine 5'-phosphosulfate sulfotransferase (PAPS reductase)/FAD synthetase
MTLDLAEYSWVVVCSSGGKDSQTALRKMVLLAEEQGYPRAKIVVSHQDLGRMEWAGTRELAEEQAHHYGLRFEVSRYRTVKGEEIDLLEYVRRRGKWPSQSNRTCTSEWKRGPGNRVLVQLSKERLGPILQCFGFRSEESAARAKRPVFQPNPRASSGKRPVTDWLPIHGWTEEQVWVDILESGVAYHPAYDLGIKRLSCSFCIFSPRAALLIAGRVRPDLLDEYVQLESEIGHDFQFKKPIKLIQEALERGEEPGSDDGKWGM